jgi:murein L,D-transpeptidase YafK
MVHGMPNCFGWLSPLLIRTDWTEGCIAVSNTAIEEIASSIKIGTKIVIEP